ncbi:PBP2 [Candida theae]|uniref:PBP2 n=1 Tax=Candida theae TaxID=1198502 RepID=A0AAD5BCL7_9ASCO|nr:PBP2 [Candida theae]KAI5950669.1 PBP2 [Candida theae]
MSESATPEPTTNALKRKNEDVSDELEGLENESFSHNKRIALDSEQLEKKESSNDVAAVESGAVDEVKEKAEGGDHNEQNEQSEQSEQNEAHQDNFEEEGQKEQQEEKKQEQEQEQEQQEESDKQDQEEHNAEQKVNDGHENIHDVDENASSKPNKVSQADVDKFLEEAALLSSLSEPPADVQPPQEELTQSSVAANQKEQDSDTSQVSFRMYCPVKEAGTIVGKQGAKIHHLREKANVKIHISDNLKDVPERIITVKGTAENVAKAFGLIVRTILGEPEDTPADLNSQQYNLKLLVPNAIIGYIIGKQGLKFREIEENSAAKLKAAEHPLGESTDRVLSVLGVADAIHIAVYFIGEVVIEHRDALKKGRVVLYNPAIHHHDGNQLGGQHQPPPPHPSQQHQQQSHQRFPNIPQAGVPASQYGNPLGYQKPFQQDGHSPYNFPVMFQPSVPPQQQYGQSAPPAPPISQGAPPQQQYTDEYNNTMIGDVIVKEPVLAGDKYNQDLYVANSSIGSVIGRGGNNIKHIRENSGCTYVKIEPDRGQSIMLGGGRGLTNIRRLTLTGSLESFQKAIYLINQRINADRQRNTR